MRARGSEDKSHGARGHESKGYRVGESARHAGSRQPGKQQADRRQRQHMSAREKGARTYALEASG